MQSYMFYSFMPNHDCIYLPHVQTFVHLFYFLEHPGKNFDKRSCNAFMGFILLLKKPGLVVLPLYGNCARSVKTDACVDGSVETFA